MIAPDRPPAGFYVYLLVDPRDDKPFYVGKGQNWRAWQHERDVRAGKVGANAKKVRRIQEIVDAGLSVTIAIAGVYDLESKALDREFKLIDASPNLVNAVPGGQGQGLSAKESARRMHARHLRMQRIRERERKAAALADAQARRSAFVERGRTAAERRDIESWLNGLSGATAERLIAPQVVRLRVDADQKAKVAANGKRVRPTRQARQFGRRAFRDETMNPADYIIREV